jgi:hypothetical protein
VIEDINKIPLFLAGLTDLPLGVIIPHLFGTTVFQEAPWPMAALVWLLERPIPRRTVERDSTPSATAPEMIS